MGFVFMHGGIRSDEQLKVAQSHNPLSGHFEARVLPTQRTREKELVEVNDLLANLWQPYQGLVSAVPAALEDMFVH